MSGSVGSAPVAPALPHAARTAKRRPSWNSLVPYLFVLPGITVLGMWLVFPLVQALQMSVHDWQIVPGAESPFVGLTHYAQLISDPRLQSALGNTLVFAIVTVTGQLALGLAVALGLESVRRGRVVFRTLYFLPIVTSWVVAALMFRYLFNSSSAGMANHLLVDVLGILEQPVSWLNEAGTAFIAIFALGIWKGVGFAMVLFIAALQAIPDEIYEAAAIDGASRRRAIRSVTLPLLAPTIVMVSVLLTIGAFQVFVPVALITNGGPLHRTEVLLTYLYDVAFRQQDFGYAGAISFALAGLVFAISQMQLRFMRHSALAG
jgi:multiple sugar transport system permease protein